MAEPINFAAMFKFLLILGIVAYILYKIGTFFFRAGVATQQMRDQEARSRARKKSGGKPGGKEKIQGGEYVDYEEVR